MEQDLIKRIVEAALLAANQPLSLAQLNALFPEEQPPAPGSLELALESLREDCAGRGIELVEVASGFRYQVRQDVYPWVARLWTERQTRYGRAVLETLALIAYRQPITRGEIEQIRGVAVSSNIIKQLEEREWIRVVGHRDVPGKPALFGTTKAFLDYFGLRSLDQLPPLTELQEIPDLEPELPFDSAPVPAAAAMPETSANDDASPEAPQASEGPSADTSFRTSADSSADSPTDAVATTTVPSHPDTAAPVAEDAATPEPEKQ
ncbi:MAG: SMC-Scp complex subunit ScpB [Rehaibacterium terrae]|uniref:SMC-Scp complex subunit ScpB n=1 Tax=Rehaibacterium terrae TaxID=1341696 RepID=UPI00391C1EDD